MIIYGYKGDENGRIECISSTGTEVVVRYEESTSMAVLSHLMGLEYAKENHQKLDSFFSSLKPGEAWKLDRKKLEHFLTGAMPGAPMNQQ